MNPLLGWKTSKEITGIVVFGCLGIKLLGVLDDGWVDLCLDDGAFPDYVELCETAWV